MPIVDRLEYPKKYKLKGTLLILIVIAALASLLWLRLSMAARAKRIVVHSVGYGEFDRNFIHAHYEIENKGKKTEKVDLLIKVYDAENKEIASILFRTKIKAKTREFQGKYIDKLYRPLEDGEKPHRLTIQFRQRGTSWMK